MKEYSEDGAYQLDNSDSCRNYYNEWALTYEKDFVQEKRYKYPQELCEFVKSRLKEKHRTVADIGCGTGLVGEYLNDTSWKIDGFDISQRMLEQAKNKNVYQNLICLDISEEQSYPKFRYNVLVSAGTFTHGHLGPTDLLKILILCEPNADCFIGVNAKHFELKAFDTAFEDLLTSQIIQDLEILPLEIYDNLGTHGERDLAKLCIFRFCGFKGSD